MENQNELKENELEKMVVVLSPIGNFISKIPIIKNAYLITYQYRLKKQFPEYQNIRFIFN